MAKLTVTVGKTTYTERARWQREFAGQTMLVVLREDGAVLSRIKGDPQSKWHRIQQLGRTEQSLRGFMRKLDNDPAYTRIH